MTTGEAIKYAVDTFRACCGFIGFLMVILVIYIATDKESKC